jgi:hypothetical protein
MSDRCPLCGAVADQYFVRDGEIVGCEECVESKWSDELFPEDTDNSDCNRYHDEKDGYYEVEL